MKGSLYPLKHQANPKAQKFLVTSMDAIKKHLNLFVYFLFVNPHLRILAGKRSQSLWKLTFGFIQNLVQLKWLSLLHVILYKLSSQLLIYNFKMYLLYVMETCAPHPNLFLSSSWSQFECDIFFSAENLTDTDAEKRILKALWLKNTATTAMGSSVKRHFPLVSDPSLSPPSR